MERLTSNNKTVDASLVLKQANFFKQAELWTSYDFERFKFRLSNEALVLSPEESAELKTINTLLMAQDGFVRGAVKLYEKTLNPKFAGKTVGGMIRKTLTSNVSSVDLAFINSNLDSLPFLVRLDLVKLRNERTGSPIFQIVEIEGDKTHAFGYVTFPKLTRNMFSGEMNKLGIVDAFKTELGSRGIDLKDPVILFLNRSEGFYLRELTVFSKVAKRFGLNLSVTTESDITFSEDSVVVGSTGIKSRVLVNIPVLTPRGTYGTGINTEKMLKLYCDKKIQVLIPPFRFLGSKGLLGIFKNSLKDPELEEVLVETFGKDLLDKLRPFIPETVNVNKRNQNKVLQLLETNPESWVIKEVSTSGMRGVSLPNSNEEKRVKMISQIKSNPFNFIIQKKIEQEKKLFTFSEPENLQEIKQAEMFMRISPFLTQEGIAEIGLTARESPAVHGSVDAIQIPVVF